MSSAMVRRKQRRPRRWGVRNPVPVYNFYIPLRARQAMDRVIGLMPHWDEACDPESTEDYNSEPVTPER